jgi:BirA family transcriptional regulator, biotin operon repressor / biotin---[acetyl-CoA-carboxylase] ligase
MNPFEEWHLETRHIGRRVRIYKRLESTNTQAAALLTDNPNNHGLVILAEEQTSGRGQHSRAWHAPPGKGVLMSVALFPPSRLSRPALLTAWAAVSVCQTIRESTGLQARIKWPNDVLIRGRKVCGILIESKVQASRSEARKNSDMLGNPAFSTDDAGTTDFAVIAGIGLNVNQTDKEFQDAALPQAGSLALAAKRTFDCPTIARLLVDHLDEEYDLLAQNDFDPLVACWKWHIGLLGKQVTIEGPDGRHWGRLREMTLDSVELEQTGGRTLRFPPEAIRHLDPA